MILAKVNRAVSDATYMRSCALALPLFFVLRFVPFFTWLGSLGFVVLSFVIPVWAVIWWSRFSDLESEDSDYIKSRKAVRMTGILVAAVLLLLVILPFMVAFLIDLLRAMHSADVRLAVIRRGPTGRAAWWQLYPRRLALFGLHQRTVVAPLRGADPISSIQ